MALGFLSPLFEGHKNFNENCKKFVGPGGEFDKCLDVLEDIMDKTGNKRYLTSDKITIADLAWFG